jgi:hypothetical protein
MEKYFFSEISAGDVPGPAGAAILLKSATLPIYRLFFNHLRSPLRFLERGLVPLKGVVDGLMFVVRRDNTEATPVRVRQTEVRNLLRHRIRMDGTDL